MAAGMLEEEHYLGAGRSLGRTLVQAVHHHGRWVALLVWGPAALKLAGRDEAIGWTDSQRAGRIGLVVQNRRFLVLAKTRMPNLASRALGLAVKAPRAPCRCAKPRSNPCATVLREVPDPRARNRVFTCSSLLVLVAMGLLAGRKSLASIQRYGQFPTQKQR